MTHGAWVLVDKKLSTGLSNFCRAVNKALTNLYSRMLIQCTTLRDWVRQSFLIEQTADMLESEVKVKVAQLCTTLCNPMDCKSVEFSRPEYWSEQPFLSPGDLPNPGIKPRSPALQADFLPAEPQGKPKHTGVGRLSLLQQVFLTQEWNLGHLHCRQIFYQLSYEKYV